MNRAARRAQARLASSHQASDAQFWRDKHDLLLGLLQALIDQAGGRLVLHARYDGKLSKRDVNINRDITSTTARIVLTAEKVERPPEPVGPVSTELTELEIVRQGRR